MAVPSGALAGASALAAFGLCDVFRILRWDEVRISGDVVEQDGDASCDGRERESPGLTLGDEPLVERAQDVVIAACGDGGHVEGFFEIRPPSLRLGLVPDCTALVVNRRAPAHLGDALWIEVADVRAVCEHSPDKARAYAFDLQESVGQMFHPLVVGYGPVAFGLYPRNLPVKLRDGAFEVPARIPVADMFELVVHDRPCFHEVPAYADILFQPFLRLGAGLDEVELLVLERYRVVADHLAVDLVRLLDTPLGFGEPPCAPGVKAHGPDTSREAFFCQGLLIRACRLEADDGIEPCRSFDHLSPAGLDVSDCFLLSVRVADVELFFADIDPHYHFGRWHDILSLSSSYQGLCIPYALSTIQAVAHDKAAAL